MAGYTCANIALVSLFDTPHVSGTRQPGRSGFLFFSSLVCLASAESQCPTKVKTSILPLPRDGGRARVPSQPD